MENRGNADDVDDVAKDSSKDGIQQDDLDQEISSDSPSMAMSSSAPSGSSPYASLSLPSASKIDDRGVARAGSVSDLKKLEHAPPSEPMHVPGLGMLDSMGRPPVGFASNHDIAPGAFPVRLPRNTAVSRTFRSPLSSYDSPRQFTNEESKQVDGLPNSAAAGIGVYVVEAQRVPDGNEDGTVMLAEAQQLTLKWYQRPLYRWILLGSILCACAFAAAVVVMVILLVRQPSAVSSSSSTLPTAVPSIGSLSSPYPTTASPTTTPITGAPTTPDPTTEPPTNVPITGAPTSPDPTAAPPTMKPTSVTPVAMACNFLSIPNVTKCRSTFVFDSVDGDTTTGSTIPSEIGLLTQLRYLSFYSNTLTSAIPSEIGLLTQLSRLSFSTNALTSSIPSEIGLLTQLTLLSFYNNSLTSAIPSEVGRLTKLSELFIWSNLLTSTIPSEIGLLTQLTWLDASNNALTSIIPSEIVLLTKLTTLYLYNNTLKGSIPSSLCSLPSLSSIGIDCGDITCGSGCCLDGSDCSSCG